MSATSSRERQAWLITGCSTGLGVSLAKAALAANQTVIAAVRNPSKVDPNVVSEIRSRGGTVVSLDVTSPTLESDFAAILAAHGPVSVLVNNAGYATGGPLEDTTVAQVRAQLETNFFGPVRLIKAALPSLRARGGGGTTIVNVSSAVYLDPHPGLSVYSSSKFAFEGLSESLAKELAPFGIRVLVVEPGSMRTSFIDPAVTDERLVQASEPYKGTPAEMVVGYIVSTHGQQPVDPDKSAAIVVKEVLEGKAGENQVLRLPLGTEAWRGMKEKAKALDENAEALKEVAQRAEF